MDRRDFIKKATMEDAPKRDERPQFMNFIR